MAGKQEKKKAGAQSSSQSHKAGIQRTFGRLDRKKDRHAKRRMNLGSSPAGERRRLAREARSVQRLVAAVERHEVARVAEAAAKVAAEKKANLSARAKKGAATRKARKEAAAAAAAEQVWATM